jgi:hypothetical protein
MAVLVMDLSLR